MKETINTSKRKNRLKNKSFIAKVRVKRSQHARYEAIKNWMALIMMVVGLDPSSQGIRRVAGMRGGGERGGEGACLPVVSRQRSVADASECSVYLHSVFSHRWVMKHNHFLIRRLMQLVLVKCLLNMDLLYLWIIRIISDAVKRLFAVSSFCRRFVN